MTNRVIGRALSWLWLVFLVVACQSSSPAALPDPTARVSPTIRPTNLPVEQPGPTSAVESTPTAPVESAAVLTLTILHTGQVYGEVLPCG
ncbi:MAG: hypothetical protein JW934_22150 [Anaerolineae bacterium]|nr:hypothetical protein [Anaerolineae bacterium]